MEKLIKLIMSLIVIVIILVILIIIFLKINRANSAKQEDEILVASTDIEKIENKMLFFEIDYNIKKYYEYLEENNTKAISSISPSSVVKLQNTDNITFQSQEMYALDKISYITVYVYGITRNKTDTDIYLIINLDDNNGTFSITKSTKEEFINAKNNKIDSKYREDIVIEENDYNTFERKIFTDIEIARYYFEDYKYKALYNPEKAFNLLDSEYKIEKFNNDINEYKAYIQNNKNNLQNAELIHYKTSKEGQYGIYEVTDNYDNYYKIIETGINEYTIILDNSTSAE